MGKTKLFSNWEKGPISSQSSGNTLETSRSTTKQVNFGIENLSSLSLSLSLSLFLSRSLSLSLSLSLYTHTHTHTHTHTRKHTHIHTQTHSHTYKLCSSALDVPQVSNADLGKLFPCLLKICSSCDHLKKVSLTSIFFSFRACNLKISNDSNGRFAEKLQLWSPPGDWFFRLRKTITKNNCFLKK